MKKIVVISIIACLFLTLKSQDHHVRFGFLGNSVTIGSGLSNPDIECYPAQIANLLEEKYGDTCIVSNYAVSGRTLLKKGDFPLWDEPLFQSGWVAAPDICFICLGTNDTKPYNWDVYGDEFHLDYLAMMDTFKLRNPNVKFIVCYPPPAFAVVWDIRNEIILDGVIPVVDSVLTEREAILIDFYNPLIDSVDLFSDKIHPNATGAKVMAKIAFDRIVESDIIHNVNTDQTFVTKFNTKKEEIRKGDSTTISWETRNANEVYLNGELVDFSGSKNIAPLSTTDYWLLAKGNISTDSLMIEQLVYNPELSKVKISPAKVTMEKGEQVSLEVLYYDQKSVRILDKVYEGAWQIIEGTGTLDNITDSMVTYIADEIGDSELQILVGEFEATVAIIVKAVTDNIQAANEIMVGYPNPCTHEYIISNIKNSTEIIDINVYNVSGKLIRNKVDWQIDKNENKVLIDTRNLNEGVYLYDLIFTEKRCSGKFIRK